MHQTLYRKYRSKTLNDLVGQGHIIQTIQNAISLDRLSHAYIFSGPRGTGKTSTARIVAKMINAKKNEILIGGSTSVNLYVLSNALKNFIKRVMK